MLFKDRAVLNSETREAISVRDGVIYYYGAEIGMEPADRVFSVYRSPATISNVHPKLNGIVVTDGHISTDMEPPKSGMGFVTDSKMVDISDEETDTTIAIKNKLDINEAFSDYINNGKRELSLAYFGDIIEHDTYDFEQVITEVHHLAAVEAGRCGSVCSFLDEAIKKPIGGNQMPKNLQAFLDQDGESVSLQKIIEITNQLPEAIKHVGVEQIMEVIPQLEEIIKMAKGEPEAEDGSGEDQSDSENEEGQMDEDKSMEDESDMDEEEDKDKESFSDSQAFRDAVQAEIASHSKVVDKARHFLDESYSFSGKTKEQVMRDALATEHDIAFSDQQLPVAFDMLKKSTGYQNFADAKSESEKDPFNELKDKEL